MTAALDQSVEPPRVATEGMRLRRKAFGDVVQFYAPGLKRWQSREWTPREPRRFVAVSVTGTACSLQCDHCEARVLQGMATLKGGATLFSRARELARAGTRGILVSGGSLKTGEVPLHAHLDDMRRAKEELGLSVLVHSGVVSEALADGLAAAGVDGVMIDVIGADETVREVYHLDLDAGAFDRSLQLLEERDLRILPHIVLGLHRGEFRGEDAALEMIRRRRVHTLILVVLNPLTGTAMGGLRPPPVDEVTAFFARARQAVPGARVHLGCGRPLGDYKVAIDKAAIDHGLNGIAYPAEGIVDYARRSGLSIELHEACCSVTWVV